MLRDAFTLIELVVVIFVLGILAGVAAPRMLDTADTAAESAAKESLAAIRDGIEMFYAANGRYPGNDGNQATFKYDLAPHVRKFPVLPVGPPSAQDAEVRMDASTGTPDGDNNPTEGWRYYYKTGDFIINSSKKLLSDNQTRYDEL